MSRSLTRTTAFSATRGPAIIRKLRPSLGIWSRRIFGFISVPPTNGRDCVDNDVFDVLISLTYLWRIELPSVPYITSNLHFCLPICADPCASLQMLG